MKSASYFVSNTVSNTIGKLPEAIAATASEVDGEAELHVTLRAGTENRIKAQSDVGSREELSEAAARNVPSFVSEHGVIEDVENIPLEFHGEALTNIKLLENPHVPLRDSGLANAVAPGVADRAIGRRGES